MAVAAQVDGTAVGQIQAHHAFVTSQQLVALEESVAFDQQAPEALRRHRVDLTNNAFDDGNNTAHGATLLKLALSWLVVAGVVMVTTKRRTDIPFYY
ncbi:hypothetical protein FQZ97_856700 [compost metagenome]